MEPKFAEFDLTEFLESGILVTINERILWPMGLALTVDYDTETKQAKRLFVSQWSYPDGHQEIIESRIDDVMRQRHAAFEAWVKARAAIMPIPAEAQKCLGML